MSPTVNDPQKRFGAAGVARLATTNHDGTPHLVPIVFALVGDVVWTAVDSKPKSTTALRRLHNVRAHPRVSLLVDVYDDDWSTLWWVRADGAAMILDVEAAAFGLDALIAKYPQYQEQRPPGPFLRIEVARWSSWSAR